MCVLLKGNTFQEEAVSEATHSRGTGVEELGCGSALKEKSLERTEVSGDRDHRDWDRRGCILDKKSRHPRLRACCFQCEVLEKSWKLKLTAGMVIDFVKARASGNWCS